MFERVSKCKGEIISLGRINSNNLDYDTGYQLLRAMLASELSPGTVLHAGNHKLSSVKGDKICWEFKLERGFIYRGVVDADNLSVAEVKLFKVFLQHVENTDYIKAGCYFFMSQQRQSLQEDLYLIKGHFKHRLSNDGVSYYDVYHVEPGVLASGCFGKIYLTSGTIKPAHSVIGESEFSPGLERRVCKIIREVHPQNTSKLMREAKIMEYVGLYKIRDISYLKSKDHIKYDPNKIEKSGKSLPNTEVYFSMRYFQGWGLDHFYGSRGLETFLSVSQSAQATLLERSMCVVMKSVPNMLFVIDGMLTSLLKDFHHKKIVHCDIKPQNIHLEFDHVSSACRVKVLDTGLSYHVDDKNLISRERIGGRAGTPLYSSLDVLRGHCQRYGDDVYAAAITIGSMFGDRRCDSYMNLKSLIEDRSKSLSAPLDLFHGLSLDESIKICVKQLLHDMTVSDVTARITLQEAVIRFRVLALECYKLQQESERRAGECDGEEGYYTFENYEIEMLDNAHIGHNFRCGLKLRAFMEKCATAMGNQENFKRLYESLIASVYKLYDQRNAMLAFSSVLGIARLMNCNTKLKLQSRIESCYTEYRYSLIKFLESYCKLYALKKENNFSSDKIHELTTYLKYADRSRQKCSSFHCTLDGMLDLTAYMKAKTFKFNRAYDHFCHVAPLKNNKLLAL